MAEPKVTVKLDIMKKLERFLRPQDAEKIGKALVQESKDFISKGISPVRGERRFAGYKNPARYPGGRKPKRPVNLELTGEMLDNLRFRLKGDRTIEYGIFSDAPEDVKIRARVHNSGERSDIAQRQFIPDQPGDEFAVAIMRVLMRLYEKRIGDVIRESNK